MSDTSQYLPPTVWTWDAENGGNWAKINRPIAGPTHEATLPIGKHPLQLYSLATPNGQKVTILLEELLALGVSGIRRAPDSNQRGPAVFFGLCRRQSQLKNSSSVRYRDRQPCVRERCHSSLFG
jgi:hypothetical protein